MGLGDRLAKQLSEIEAKREADIEAAKLSMAARDAELTSETLKAILFALSDDVLERIIRRYAERGGYRVTFVGIKTGKYGFFSKSDARTAPIDEWDEDISVSPSHLTHAWNHADVQSRVENLSMEGIVIDAVQPTGLGDDYFRFKVDFTRVGSSR